MKKAVNYVALNRAEGPSNECGAVIFYVGEVAPRIEDKHFAGACLRPVKAGEITTEVLRQFRNWGYSAPQGGGYDKCDFEVGWEGGQSYNGRFDMQYGGTDGRENFWASLQGRLEFYSLRRRPVHFKDAHWANFCKVSKESGDDVEAAKMLDECDMAA